MFYPNKSLSGSVPHEVGSTLNRALFFFGWLIPRERCVWWESAAPQLSTLVIHPPRACCTTDTRCPSSLRPTTSVSVLRPAHQGRAAQSLHVLEKSIWPLLTIVWLWFVSQLKNTFLHFSNSWNYPIYLPKQFWLPALIYLTKRFWKQSWLTSRDASYVVPHQPRES